ncbi:hypothetical protein ORV05_13715 [Amycolatopsis cynarae]|uniref:Uncharacterized protein n=1 Tax=Amycolatopsis cynarae TaxID=2995223 RepID=A0ABY7B8T4_9PSEU|nr:hypothetical protein ORV05_13715 [Amycolatopsis sp. HUAS 11-8]
MRFVPVRLEIQRLLDDWVFSRGNGESATLRAMFAADGRKTTNYAGFTADEFLNFIKELPPSGPPLEPLHRPQPDSAQRSPRSR